MNILVIGSGGREHALVWKLRQSKKVTKLYCAPGNPGMKPLAEPVALKAGDTPGILKFVEERKIDLTVVGPEQPLAEGIVDAFAERHLNIFGPTRRAAELEWSKAFAKAFMQRHDIPTAANAVFSGSSLDAARRHLSSCPLPVVVKADGLAAGKGVIVCTTREEALQGLHEIAESKAFGSAGDTVVIEEWLDGEEASVFAVSDGSRYVTLAPAQDHKRVFDGDRGRNTGGMGAYAPTPIVTDEVLKMVENTIIRPTLDGMAGEGREYRGCLYVGLMLTKDGPKVVEYNVRFGDPETQVVLPLFEGDLAELLLGASLGKLPDGAGRGENRVRSAVCVVLASGGYPDVYPTGIEVHGLEDLEGIPNVVAFHAGTREVAERIVTAGGRVLGITAYDGEGLIRTIERAYDAVRKITFQGMHYRSDIGRKGLLS